MLACDTSRNALRPHAFAPFLFATFSRAISLVRCLLSVPMLPAYIRRLSPWAWRYLLSRPITACHLWCRQYARVCSQSESDSLLCDARPRPWTVETSETNVHSFHFIKLEKRHPVAWNVSSEINAQFTMSHVNEETYIWMMIGPNYHVLIHKKHIIIYHNSRNEFLLPPNRYSFHILSIIK